MYVRGKPLNRSREYKLFRPAVLSNGAPSSAGSDDGDRIGPARVGEVVYRPRAGAVDRRTRGGGHAARAGRLAGLALGGRVEAAAADLRGARARRDARACTGALDESARDGRGGDERVALP